MFLTRAEAAQYLAKNLLSKTAPQWHTFLNDNARNRNSPKIKFKSNSGVGGKSLYKELDLMMFIESQTHPRHTSLAATMMDAYGMHHEENITSRGQALGWRNSKVEPVLLAPDAVDDGIVMQLLIHTGRKESGKDKRSSYDLKALALTSDEAECLANDILNSLAVINPTIKRPPPKHEMRVINF